MLAGRLRDCGHLTHTLAHAEHLLSSRGLAGRDDVDDESLCYVENVLSRGAGWNTMDSRRGRKFSIGSTRARGYFFFRAIERENGVSALMSEEVVNYGRDAERAEVVAVRLD